MFTLLIEVWITYREYASIAALLNLTGMVYAMSDICAHIHESSLGS